MDIPHELRGEFPQEISLIERMIRTNYEFRRLAERYDEVNRNIYRIESGEEPTTDEGSRTVQEAASEAQG